jgi:hypothetical protein
MASNLAFCFAACGSVAGLYDEFGAAAAVAATIVWATVAAYLYRRGKKPAL